MHYAVLSDLHCHAWSMFSTINPATGVNTRLELIIKETERAAATLKTVGGDLIFIAGDIFHTRGVIDPEVLNPVRDSFARLVEDGFRIMAIPGNHDLKSPDTNELSSAIQNLNMGDVADPSFLHVLNKRDAYWFGHETTFLFVPWRHKQEDLLADIEELAARSSVNPASSVLFIHAGIDDVLPGTPSSGLTDTILGGFGFKRVFAGHYHNHKILRNGVVSIGATTHHNWGDVGSRSGFLIVDDKSGAVTFHDTRAPKFVDVSGLSETDMELECDGNYVRFRGPPMTQTQIKEIRAQFERWGAKGVLIQVPPVTTTSRTTAPIKGLTLKESIDRFVDPTKLPFGVTKEEVVQRANEILDLSQAVTEES